MPQLSGLFIYPVKSCRGHSVASAAVDDYGLVDDRRFMIVNLEGHFQQQRIQPRMALIDTALTKDSLTLGSPGRGEVSVPRNSPPGAVLTAFVWNDTVEADDCGDDAAGWLTEFFGFPARLVRMGEKFHRAVRPGRAQPGDIYSFADGAPFLITSESSLVELNERIRRHGGEPVPMNRFRPNLVVAGCAPFAEDTWPRFRLGGVVFRSVDPCARCVITTTDQRTAARGKEPLRTLATFRRDAHDPTNVNFGQNLVHETKRGTLRVGDPVELL